MPQHKSVEKRLRQNKKRNLANRYIRSTLRTEEKKLRKLESTSDAGKVLANYFSLLDKAVKRNILKKDTVNRKKSRMQKHINSFQG